MGEGRAAAPGPSRPPNKAGDELRAAGGATWRARSAAAGPAGRPPPVLGSARRAGADPCPLKGPAAPAFRGPATRGTRRWNLRPPPFSLSDSQVVFLFKGRPAPPVPVPVPSWSFPQSSIARDSAVLGCAVPLLRGLAGDGNSSLHGCVKGKRKKKAQPTPWGAPSAVSHIGKVLSKGWVRRCTVGFQNLFWPRFVSCTRTGRSSLALKADCFPPPPCGVYCLYQRRFRPD